MQQQRCEKYDNRTWGLLVAKLPKKGLAKTLCTGDKSSAVPSASTCINKNARIFSVKICILHFQNTGNELFQRHFIPWLHFLWFAESVPWK